MGHTRGRARCLLGKAELGELSGWGWGWGGLSKQSAPAGRAASECRSEAGLSSQFCYLSTLRHFLHSFI